MVAYEIVPINVKNLENATRAAAEN